MGLILALPVRVVDTRPPPEGDRPGNKTTGLAQSGAFGLHGFPPQLKGVNERNILWKQELSVYPMWAKALFLMP
jgi:hypothetical protein